MLSPHKRPPGYRSQKLRNYLKERGARKTTLWGATAIRGDLEPEKKGHIIEFLKLVNQLPSDPGTLKEALNSCTDLYVQKVNSETPEIELPLSSTVQTSIVQLLSTQTSHATAGKIPQGLVYALLKLKYRDSSMTINIFTKRTHAGDSQSGLPGDVRVTRDGRVSTVFEIKGKVLDTNAIDRILPTHGRHTYPLFILALGFRPSSLKREINEKTNTFAIDLGDYFWTVFSELAISTNMPPSTLLSDLINIYDEEFCEKIEHDSTIKIKQVELEP